MPNLKWSVLSNLQLGRYGEYFAMMDFASYGYQVFTSEVDDHGIDFIARKPGCDFLEIQVKSLRIKKSSYTFVREKHFDISKDNLFIYLLLFVENEYPSAYLIPASIFRNSESSVFSYKSHYKVPEYGINVSQKSMPLLDAYKFDKLESR